MSAPVHIIARQRVRLRYHGMTDALALRSMTHTLCTEELPARLNQLFDRYDEPGMVLQLGRIAVLVNLSNEAEIRDRLASAITEEVERKLRKALEERIDKALSVQDNLMEALVFYLQRGILPWWSVTKDTAAFREEIQSFFANGLAPAHRETFLRLMSNAHARLRLIALLDVAAMEAFMRVLSGFTPSDWGALLKWWHSLRDSLAVEKNPSPAIYDLHCFIIEALTSVPQQQGAYSEFQVRLSKILGKNGIPTERMLGWGLPAPESVHIKQRQLRSKELPLNDRTDRPGQDEESLNEAAKSLKQSEENLPDSDERILTQSAGLVIVAPFLPGLFRNLNLLKEDVIMDVPRAIALLRFLLAGTLPYMEPELALEKILCGLPLQHSLPPAIELEDADKDEALALLQSVIEHWSALKKTSPEGLRHNFLQREGRLQFSGSEWKLTVQRATHDILLDRLPWSISMIKLPWMRQLLMVEWNR